MTCEDLARAIFVTLAPGLEDPPQAHLNGGWAQLAYAAFEAALAFEEEVRARDEAAERAKR